MHESFHNFGLDFSDMDTSECNKKILSIFQIDSQVNLFEAYTEFWAEILNVCFSSFYLLENKHQDISIVEYLKTCYFLIDIERSFSFIQMIKILNFMGLDYKDLYLNTYNSSELRTKLYKEKSNILSYYILKTIILYNYQDFFEWCNINNKSLFQFQRTKQGILLFCNFIEKYYKKTSIINVIDCMKKFFNKLMNGKYISNKLFLMNNMRMSVCELE